MKTEKVMESEIYFYKDIELGEAIIEFIDNVKIKFNEKELEKTYIKNIKLDSESFEVRLCKFENLDLQEANLTKFISLDKIRKEISELKDIYRDNDYFAGIDVLNTLELRIIKNLLRL